MMDGSSHGQGEGIGRQDQDDAARTRPPVTRRFARGAKIIAALIVIAIALFGWGLWIFADRIENAEAILPNAADGIVVLTGGPDRIAEGLDLLAGGRGKRLLITGVGPGASLEKIGKPMPRYKLLLDCCVDIEYAAQNTVGNALATREWASRNGYHSLIVVTSSYHLPRALTEFRRAMPGATLFSHPVNSDRVSGERWWRDGAVARLIVLEYGKFLVAWCRLHVSDALFTHG